MLEHYFMVDYEKHEDGPKYWFATVKVCDKYGTSSGIFTVSYATGSTKAEVNKEITKVKRYYRRCRQIVEANGTPMDEVYNHSVCNNHRPLICSFPEFGVK